MLCVQPNELSLCRNGSNILGYFVWSFVDCFELMFGYTARYGLYGVDFNGVDRSRFPRLSAHWYSNFLKNSGLKTQAANIIHTEWLYKLRIYGSSQHSEQFWCRDAYLIFLITWLYDDSNSMDFGTLNWCRVVQVFFQISFACFN